MMTTTYPQKKYDKQTDSWWYLIKPGVVERIDEIAPGVTVEFDSKGDLIGIEVLQATLRETKLKGYDVAKGQGLMVADGE